MRPRRVISSANRQRPKRMRSLARRIKFGIKLRQPTDIAVYLNISLQDGRHGGRHLLNLAAIPGFTDSSAFN